MQKQMIFLAVLLAAATTATAQTYFTRDAKLKFDATAKASPDKIEALHSSVTCVLEASTGEMGFQVLIKGFKFEKALMQEHFNENYLESDKFPKAIFRGKITNLREVNLSKDGTYNAIVTGKMEIHGVEKELTTNGAIRVADGNIKINAGFNVLLADYKIKIPSVVSANIAKEAKILVDATLVSKK
jgi:polyisoprenoid-binding protein YceI